MKNNILKGWITSIAGGLLMISSILVGYGFIPTHSNPSAGLLVGGFILGLGLLIMPKTVEDRIKNLITKRPLK